MVSISSINTNVIDSKCQPLRSVNESTKSLPNNSKNNLSFSRDSYVSKDEYDKLKADYDYLSKKYDVSCRIIASNELKKLDYNA